MPSGATEANNLALRGAVEAGAEGRRRMLVSAVEHASVARAARWLADSGLLKLDMIRVTAGGALQPWPSHHRRRHRERSWRRRARPRYDLIS